MKNSIHVLEHTPIYDLAAYNERQKQRKRVQFIKYIFKSVSAFCVATLIFSILFLGE